jgi:Glutaredoxin-like domain (DUF836)
MVLRLYSKPGCSLCDQARDILEQVRTRIPFELVEEDIRADPALFTAYRYDIPVVLVDGQPAFKLRFEAREVEAFLQRAQGGTSVAHSEGQGEHPASHSQENRGDGRK